MELKHTLLEDITVSWFCQLGAGTVLRVAAVNRSYYISMGAVTVNRPTAVNRSNPDSSMRLLKDSHPLSRRTVV